MPEPVLPACPSVELSPVPTGRRFTNHTKVFRFRPESRFDEALCGKPTLQKLANGRRATRHLAVVAEIVDYNQFLRCEHELQTFSTREVRHRSLH
jgi:hypothetical protein